MKKLTESELKEIEKMNNEKKDIVTFVLFETGILLMIVGFMIQASKWLGTAFLIIGFASLLMTVISKVSSDIQQSTARCQVFPEKSDCGTEPVSRSVFRLQIE